MTNGGSHHRAARGAATRQALVAAATELITEVGWGAVTTRGVAERAGVRPGLVHYHFASVEALRVSAAAEASHDLVSRTDELLAAAPDVAAGIDQLVVVATAVTDDASMRFLTESLLAATRITELADAIAADLALMRHHIAAWLADADHPGDHRAVAALLVAALDGYALQRAVDPSLSPHLLRTALRAAAGIDQEDRAPCGH